MGLVNLASEPQIAFLMNYFKHEGKNRNQHKNRCTLTIQFYSVLTSCHTLKEDSEETLWVLRCNKIVTTDSPQSLALCQALHICQLLQPSPQSFEVGGKSILIIKGDREAHRNLAIAKVMLVSRKLVSEPDSVFLSAVLH